MHTYIYVYNSLSVTVCERLLSCTEFKGKNLSDWQLQDDMAQNVDARSEEDEDLTVVLIQKALPWQHSETKLTA